MNKYFIWLSLFFVSITLLQACGEGVVELSDSTYNPKIVINGYLYPHQKVEKIYIMRNIPLSSSIRIDRDSILLPNAEVQLMSLPDSSTYTLTYNPAMKFYEYNGTDLTIEYAHSYQLSVKAVIDSTELEATSVTTVPEQGFIINDTLSLPDSMSYRETDPLGALKFFTICFDRSPNVDSYIFSFTALDADSSTYVYSPVNPFADEDSSDVMKYLRDFKYTNDLSLNLPMSVGQSEHKVLWFELRFYGWYQVIVYACDRNFKDFYLTYGDVQEIDGNFHEPVMHISGEGIGIFGSAIADTAYFKILR